MTERKCKNCLCWQLDVDKGDGICVARAPVPAIMSAGSSCQLVLARRAPGEGCYHDFVSAEEVQK